MNYNLKESAMVRVCEYFSIGQHLGFIREESFIVSSIQPHHRWLPFHLAFSSLIGGMGWQLSRC